MEYQDALWWREQLNDIIREYDGDTDIAPEPSSSDTSPAVSEPLLRPLLSDLSKGSDDQTPSTEAPRVIVFSIHGFACQHPSLHHSGLSFPPESEVINFSFKPESFVGKDASNYAFYQIAEDLLKQLRPYGGEWHDFSRVCFVFLACDIGGSVLKKALVIASSQPELAGILERSPVLIFIGTPHRPSLADSRELLLSRLIHNLFHGICDSWLPEIVSNISAMEERLAADFEKIAGKFKIVNFFQEESASGAYEVLVGKHSATLNRNGEIQVGLRRSHKLLADFYTRKQQRLVEGMVEHAQISLRHDHVFWIRLLSSYVPGMNTVWMSKPLMKNLCQWILIRTNCYDWFSNRECDPEQDIEELKASGKTSTSGISTTIRVLTLEDSLHRNGMLLVASLVAAIKLAPDKHDPDSIFVTLVQQGRHRPLTEAQLLASICLQLLTFRPRLVDEISQFFKEARGAILGQNEGWSRGLLCRCLKRLFCSPNLGQVFVIVHRPNDLQFANPYDKICAVLEKLLAGTAVSCKIIVLRRLSEETSITPAIGEYEIRLESGTSISAARLDFETELGFITQRVHFTISSNLHFVRGEQESGGRALIGTRRGLPLSHPTERIGFVFDFLEPAGVTSERKIQAIVSCLPVPIQHQITTALIWIYYAIRPLQLSEVDEIIALSMEGISDQSTDRLLAQELVDILSGVLEVENGIVLLWRPDLVKYFVSKKGLTLSESKIDTDSNANANMAISLACVNYLFKHFLVPRAVSRAHDDDSVSILLDERDTVTAKHDKPEVDSGLEYRRSHPLLQYAVEFWFAHFQESSQSHKIDEGAFAKFVHDDINVNLWLRLRESFRTVDSTLCPRVLPVSLENIKTGLGATTYDALELLLDSTSIEVSRGRKEDEWTNICIAAAQKGNEKTLSILSSRQQLYYGKTLSNVFESGEDAVLCGLLDDTNVNSKIQEGISILKILRDAVRRGNVQLMERITIEHLSQLKFDSYRQSLLPMSAEFQVSLPEALLKTQEGFIDNTDPNIHNGRSSLHLAAMSGNTNLVAWLLQCCPNSVDTANMEDRSGDSSLLLAVRNGHLAIVKQLLVAGAKVSAGNADLQTPLHEAAANGYSGIIVVLLDYKADASAKNKQHKTPLHLALENDHPTVGFQLIDYVKSLIKPPGGIEFNIDAEDINGATPLMHAITWNRVDLVKTLVESGANISTTDARGRTPLHLVAKLGRDAILSLFKIGPSVVNLADKQGDTALHFAARRGHVECIKKLLDAGADEEISNDKGLTPLNEACTWGQPKAVENLMRPGSPVKNLSKNLIYAVVSKSYEVTRILLEENVDKNVQNAEGETPLHIAAWNSDAKLLQLLLSRGVDVDTCDHQQRTPLFAAVNRDISCVKMLLDAGADVDAVDVHGNNPLLRACLKEAPEIVRLLLKAGAPLRCPEFPAMKDFLNFALQRFSVPLMQAIAEHLSGKTLSSDLIDPDIVSWIIENRRESAVDLLRIILDLKFPLEKPILEGKTILQKAAEANHLEVASFLTRGTYKVDINMVTETHGTALQVAAAQGHSTMVRLLLSRDADLRRGGGYHGAPLHAAANMGGKIGADPYSGYIQIIRFLFRRDYARNFLNHPAGFFGTPLQAAVASSSRSMVRWILSYNPNHTVVSGVYGTPLHTATHKLDGSMIRYLLDERGGFPRTSLDREGRLPLHIAAAKGRDDLVELLSEGERASVTIRDHQKRHALHFAAAGGAFVVATEILEEHSNIVNDEDCDGWTPLHWACRQEEIDMARLLIENGADRYKRTHRGWLPIDVAIYHKKAFASFNEIENLLGFPGNTVSPEEKTSESMDDPGQVLRPALTPGTMNHAKSYDDEECLPVREADASRSTRYRDFFCDSCLCSIYGPRYNCQSCINFDACFKCFRNITISHYTNHEFKKFSPQGEEQRIINPWSDEVADT